MTDEDKESSHARKKMATGFWLAPLIFSILFLVTFIILKLIEPLPNSFMSWVSIVFWCLGVSILSFGGSMMLYFIISLMGKKSGEISYNGREECDRLIRDEVMRKDNYQLLDFTDIGHSGAGILKSSGKNKEKFYFHLYRIKEKGNARFLLAIMNMQKGLEDDVIFDHSPLNFKGKLTDLAQSYADIMAQDKVDFGEKVVETRNDMTGTSQRIVTKNPVNKDNDEDEDDEKK